MFKELNERQRLAQSLLLEVRTHRAKADAQELSLNGVLFHVLTVSLVSAVTGVLQHGQRESVICQKLASLEIKTKPSHATYCT